LEIDPVVDFSAMLLIDWKLIQPAINLE
jgi:hypothetical protein